LKKVGLIEVVKEETKKGAICKYFAPTSAAFGVEIGGRGEESRIKNERANKKVKEFFHEFIKDGIFDGSIVVGSPTQHGPFLTSARDGHYAIQLAMFLGNFCGLTNRFIVKLDTEVKAEGAEKRNMILIGGPVTNMISSDINEKLKIRFKWQNGWRIFSEITKEEYVNEDIGIIAKMRNPWDRTKSIIVLAGLKFEGTKSCIIAITHYFDKILKKYRRKEEFFSLIKGLDRDGDGKVDDIELLE
jgi:hypothetical protein